MPLDCNCATLRSSIIHQSLDISVSEMIPDPTLLSFLTNNASLPEHLKQSITGYLDHLARTPVSLDAQERLEIQDVQEGSRKVKDDYTRFLHAISPISRLPPEIIALVLCASLSEWMPLGSGGRLRFIQLRSVCSSWRKTAFSTPELWQALSVDVERYEISDQVRTVQQICRWFARAGELPLQLLLRQMPVGVTASQMLSLVEALPYLSHVLFHPIRSYQDFTELISKPNPNSQIRTLDLRFKDNHSSTSGPDCLDQAFPILSHLSVRYQSRGAALIVTHANLTTLHLHKVNFRAQHPLSSLLDELPALEKLYITLCNFYRKPSENRRNVPTHHSLRHLVIGYSNSMPTRVFSGSLPLCPRLERITFVPSISCNISPLEDQEEVPYLEFVSEPHAHLTIDLSHLNDSTAAAAALPMASSMSRLNVLTLFNITMVSIIKLSLTWIEACPLRTIISRTSPIGWGNSHWMDWAEALAPARKQLPDVKFYLPKMPSDLSETTATSLRSSGINLVFLSQNEIQRRLGDLDIEEYLETRQSWDPNNIAF